MLLAATTDSWHWFHVTTMTTFQHDSWQHDMRPTACTHWSEPQGRFCNNGDTCKQTYLMAMLGLWRLVRRLVVTACAVLWWCVPALCEGWRAELVQLSIAATWHRPWPDHSAAHRCPGHTAPTTSQRNLMQCSTVLCTLCCSVPDIVMIINDLSNLWWPSTWFTQVSLLSSIK